MGLIREAQELTPVPSLRLPIAKYPLHPGGVRQWLQEDLPNSSMLWWGFCKGLRVHTSAITVVASCQVPITPGWGEAMVAFFMGKVSVNVYKVSQNV